MRHLTPAAAKQAKGLGLSEEDVIRMDRESAPYTDPHRYFNRRFDDYILRRGNQGIHAVTKIREVSDGSLELLILARNILRSTINEDLDPAVKENAEAVLGLLDKATPNE